MHVIMVKNIVRYLVEHGADINKGDGSTPLHLACEKGHKNIVKYLVEHGADINNKGERCGWTPLQYACYYGNENIAKYLIEHGADINKTNNYGSTPLHFACEKGHKNIVKYLVEHGADINKTDDKHKPPLFYAYENGHYYIVRYLIEHGADSTSVSAEAIADITKPLFSTSASITTTTTTTTKTASKPAATIVAPTVTPATEPPTISALRNKTMEEILNKWTTELNHYHTEFQKIAINVGKWDQMIIRNGAQIYNLNSQIEEIEKIQNEIDTNLEYIDNQQTELNSILSEYEKKIILLVDNSNNDLGGKLNPADKERESAYNTAENLSKQLDDLDYTLSDMIKEINNTKDRTEGEDDDENTINHIVKILNGHLRSLQWIDQSTTELGLQIQELSRLNDTATAEQERIQKLTKRTLHNDFGFDTSYSRFGNRSSPPKKKSI